MDERAATSSGAHNARSAVTSGSGAGGRRARRKASVRHLLDVGLAKVEELRVREVRADLVVRLTVVLL